jgi:hypothetical protein
MKHLPTLVAWSLAPLLFSTPAGAVTSVYNSVLSGTESVPVNVFPGGEIRGGEIRGDILAVSPRA